MMELDTELHFFAKVYRARIVKILTKSFNKDTNEKIKSEEKNKNKYSISFLVLLKIKFFDF